MIASTPRPLQRCGRASTRISLTFMNQTAPESDGTPAPKSALSPWPIRLIVFAVLVALALVAIRVIDGHAMVRQRELGLTDRSASTSTTEPADGS